MENNHYFAENGVYLSSAPANAGSMPPENAVRTPPPFRDGYWPVWERERGAWALREDHRGRTGWVDGAPATIAALGPLPDNWTDEPPPRPDTRTAAERRRDDFAAEADPLREQAVAYQLEAEALRLAGETEQAAAEGKRLQFLARYLAKKKQIRARHPKEDARDAAGAAEEENAGPALYLTSSGTYHRSGCRYTSSAGRWVTAGELRALGGKTKPCCLCKAALPEE